MMRRFAVSVLLISIGIFLLTAATDRRSLMMRQARNLETASRYSDAREVYRELLRLHPGYFNALEKLVTNLLRENLTDEAEEEITKFKGKIIPEQRTRLQVLVLLR
ncbi:MAG: hypothetical protein K8S56_06010 [Candidatus Cloacimonetes bacterium]|nr:hypothetical protein [Candidatus Cloacimonadota bacterium]